MAELVRETAISRATAHAVVGQLVACGWLQRGGNGAITVGRTFAALGRRLGAIEPLATLAQPHLLALSARLSCPVCLVERDGDAVVITDRVVAPDAPSERGPRLGDAAPFRAPYGREFVAWEAPECARDWRGARDTPRLHAVLETIRVRGYGVDRLGEDTVRMLRALVAEAPETTESIAGSIATNFAESAVLDVLDGELVAGELYRVVNIAAPVFDVDATVRATVTVAPQRHLSAREIGRHGESAVAVADAITEWGGTKPSPRH